VVQVNAPVIHVTEQSVVPPYPGSQLVTVVADEHVA